MLRIVYDHVSGDRHRCPSSAQSRTQMITARMRVPRRFPAHMYVPRREIRRADKERASQKYKVRKVGEKKREGRRAAFGVPEDPLEDAFDE